MGCCVASLVDVHPADLPNEGVTGRDRDELNEWLQARFGRRLEVVRGQHYTDMPRGHWIALLHRGSSTAHAVLAEGSQVLCDPAGHKPGFLWPDDLACAHDPDLPLGWRLVAA
jgi:hypothetical protein